MSNDLNIEQSADGVTVSVKVVPSSSRTRIAGLYNHGLKINIAAAAEKNKANRQLTRYLAKRLGLPSSAVTIVAGQHARQKRIHLAGISVQQLRELLICQLS